MLDVVVLQGTQELFRGRAAKVVLPTDAGEIGILPFHAPMLCAVAPGHLLVDEQRLRVAGGVAGVSRNRVTVVTHAWTS
jgi:F-type H+-transporting ATPase subunit epsilon